MFFYRYYIYSDSELYQVQVWTRITQLSCSSVWHFILKMQIVSTNPASAMKLYPELFCTLIYQSQFPARWLTQLLFSLVVDVDSNSGMPHVCSMCSYVLNVCVLNAGGEYCVYIPNCNKNTNNSHTSNTSQEATRYEKQNIHIVQNQH